MMKTDIEIAQEAVMKPITEVAAALILGILANVMLSKKKGNAAKK